MRALAVAALLLATEALAWDTWISTRHNWGSVYSSKFGGVGSYLPPYMDPKGNEHAEISDHVMHTVSPEMWKLFGTHADPSCTTACDQMPVMVDLNASFMRPELFGVDDLGRTNNPTTVLEERRFPRLAMWAGLPDFNYTLYDWINKSTRCPSLPQSADRYDLCHTYRAWLGAGTNSTHMGELNVKVYARLHAIAMAQATKARELRTALSMGGRTRMLPTAAGAWYADYLREADLLALTYEQIGQHFLHDRWSIGHMFSRWGAGSYEELQHDSFGKKPSLDKVASYGTLTGIVHGSLAVFGKPDPLSAPAIDYATVIGKDAAVVMSWRYSLPNALFGDPHTTRFYGLGDYLYRDIVDDLYDGSVLHPEYQDIRKIPPIPVKAGHQKKGILGCGGDGLRTVIAGLGANGAGYGAFELPLRDPDPNLVLPGMVAQGTNPATNPVCTDLWAANDSYYEAARSIAGSTWLLGDGLVNDIVVAVGTAIEGEEDLVIPPSVRNAHGVPAIEKYTPPIQRVIVPLSRVIWRSWVNKTHDENSAKAAGMRVIYGTDSAKQGLSFENNGLRYRPNGNYALPPYYEPEDLDTLPWWNETQMGGGRLPAGGRDRASINGLFNKARVEDWCKTLYGNERNDPKVAVTLKLLREKGLEYEIDFRRSIPTGEANAKRTRAMCSYLANRVYKATDPDYTGTKRKEIIGEHLPFDQAAKFGPTYEPICAYFDGPGGIPIITPDATDDDKPYLLKPGYVGTPGEKGAWGYAPKSLESWCSLAPVINVGMIPGAPDAAGEILHDDGNRWLKLKGENVGMKTLTGKVGSITAFDQNGMPRALDIWDPVLLKETGGWSADNLVVWGRIPASKNGFPTTATAAMTPKELKALAPTTYTFELTRPDDVQARLYFRANGAKTVGTYEFRVYPSWVESTNFAVVSGGQKAKGIWVTDPAWSRAQVTRLATGLFTVDAMGNYSEITAATLTGTYGVSIEERLGQYPVIDASGVVSWVPDKDRRGYLYTHPIALPSSVFNAQTSFFASFH